MGIAVLGPLTVDGQSNGLAPRDRVVLAVLAMTPGAPVSTERLADALWPDQPPASWAKVIQSAVVRLRRVLGPSAIETVPHGYRLTLPARDVDAHEFEHLVVRARAQMVLGEVDRAAYSLDQALRLWRGQALVELEGWDQGRIEASRLAELCRDAEELQVEAALRSGRHREVLARAQALVQAAPLRERRWELLATAQYQSGRQGDALRTLRQVRKVLLDELGLDPGPDVVALEQAILRQDPALAPDLASAEGSALCPYRGLVPFDIEDADDFFGREHDVAVCLERLGATGMLAVVGPSGSGKSSLVRAGVAAALRRDGQWVVVTSPGHRPMDALAAVPASRTPFVLVVDQGEEALSLCEDEQERADFFVALADHARRGPLVLVLRADRLGEISGYDDIARLVEHGLFLLNPMSVDGLRAAIESPAQRAGLHLEPGLTDLLLREVEDEAGGLPLLSHALRQTWQRREGGTLTVDGYRATGGIRHAVAQSAESLYEQVEPDQRPALRDLMLRLVIPTPDGEPTRSRVPRRVVDADGRRADLIDRLVAARLVTSDEGVVEIAHESLVRAWPRLRGWLDEDTEGQRILRHLTIAGDTWDAMGRPDAELYRGARLAQAVEWRDRAAPDLSRTERDFLDAGQRLAETEEQSAIRQAQQQRRVNRRLRGLLAGVAFLLIAALVAGTLAVRQADRATDATRVADARRVASLSQLADPVDDSLQLALAAVGLEDSAETSAALLAALSRSPQLSYHVPAADVPMADLDTHPRNHEAAVMDHAGRVRLYSPDSVDPLAEFDRTRRVGRPASIASATRSPTARTGVSSPSGCRPWPIDPSGCSTGARCDRWSASSVGSRGEPCPPRSTSAPTAGWSRSLSTASTRASCLCHRWWSCGTCGRPRRRFDGSVPRPTS
jgi:DNA-binding SARP family transcriptional activator/energy-coupling factor transporter ATP-binding protein EcfA2